MYLQQEITQMSFRKLAALKLKLRSRPKVTPKAAPLDLENQAFVVTGRDEGFAEGRTDDSPFTLVPTGDLLDE